jgi:hypothetical protein
MITMTDEIRSVLKARSVKDKIGVAVDCDLAPVGQLNTVSMLVREGMLVFIERAVLPHLAITDKANNFIRHPSVDVYQMTPACVALCDANGIERH